MGKRLIIIAAIVFIIAHVSNVSADLSPLGLRAASDVCKGDLVCMQKMADKFEERCANAKKRITEDPSLIFYYKSILSMCDCTMNTNHAATVYNDGQVQEGSTFESNIGFGFDDSDLGSSRQGNEKLIQYLEHSMKNDAELSEAYDRLVKDASKLSSSLNGFNSNLDGHPKIQSKYSENGHGNMSDINDDAMAVNYVSDGGYISTSEQRVIIKQMLLEGKEYELSRLGYTPKEIDAAWRALSAKEKTVYFEKNYGMAAKAIDIVKGVAVSPPVDFLLTTILNDEISLDKALELAGSSMLKKVKFLSGSPKELAKFYKKRGHSLTQKQIEDKIKEISIGIKVYEGTQKKAGELESVFSRD